jgi:hypothetical protein
VCNLCLLFDISPLSFHSTNLKHLKVPAFGGVIGTLLALSSNFGPLMEAVNGRPTDGSFPLRGFLCSMMDAKGSRRLWCRLLDVS